MLLPLYGYQVMLVGPDFSTFMYDAHNNTCKHITSTRWNKQRCNLFKCVWIYFPATMRQDAHTEIVPSKLAEGRHRRMRQRDITFVVHTILLLAKRTNKCSVCCTFCEMFFLFFSFSFVRSFAHSPKAKIMENFPFSRLPRLSTHRYTYYSQCSNERRRCELHDVQFCY